MMHSTHHKPGLVLGVLVSFAMHGAVLFAAESLAPPSYPREVSLPGGKVVIHHPTVTDWRDFEVLSAWVPLEVTPSGSSVTWIGSVLAEADTVTEFEQRVVALSNVRFVQARAESGLSAAALSLQQSPAAQQLARDALAQGRQTVGLEFLLRALPADFEANRAARATPGLSFAPPRIIISNRPMQLMLIDGPPKTSAIEGTRLEYVVNTNWDVFHHLDTSNWYLINEDAWLQNNMLAGGDWLVAKTVPRDFETLAMRSELDGLQSILPPRPPAQAPLPITISYDPAELVVINGQAELVNILGTDIDYVANTQQDLFREGGSYYLLLSGRWFAAKELKGDWQAVKQLPADFSAIPPEHAKGHVLAAVPGTEKARLALIEAAMPHDRLVLSSAGEGLEVEYAGAPEFVGIDGTALRRAVNTPYQVIQHNNFYYLCDDGAWFMSVAPSGPWSVATELPQAIYTIPPTDPAYNVTFVRLKEFDKSSGQVAYSFTSGYGSNYSTGTSVVYGTGWNYRGSIYYRGAYPVYGSYPPSYGYGAWYHPAYGRYGYRGYHDPYWGYPRSTSVTISKDIPEKDWEWKLDGSKRTVYAQGPRNTIGSGTYQLNGAKPYQGSQEKGAAETANNGAEDLYTGPDGEIFRHWKGQWQTYSDGQWLPAGNNIPTEVLRQYQARQQGYRSYDQFRAGQNDSPVAN